MESIVATVAGFAIGILIQSLAALWVIRGINSKQSIREELHRAERMRQNERMSDQVGLYYKERADLHKRLDEQDKRLVEQERLHQTERRELYERIQGGAPVYTQPLLTGDQEKGKNKGAARDLDSDDMSPEQLARLKIQENSDGGFIDTVTGVLYENVKALLHYRQEAVEEKKGLTEKIE